MSARKYLIGIKVLLSAGLVGSCKLPKEDTNLASLENLASGQVLVVNQCGAPPGTKASNWAHLVARSVKFDASVPASRRPALARQILAPLSAVPPPVLRMFHKLRGYITLTETPGTQCGEIFRDDPRMKRVFERFDPSGCYMLGPDKQFQKKQGLRIVLDADSKSISHGLVRQFGYFVAQVVPRLFLQGTEGIKDVWVMTDQEPEGFATSKRLLAAAYIKDIQSNLAFDLRATAQLIGVPKNPEMLASRLGDYVFAEAFDSYYCNSWASYDSALYEKVRDGLSPLSVLSAGKPANSRQIMRHLFRRTHRVFSKLHCDMIAPNDRSCPGVSLTGPVSDGVDTPPSASIPFDLVTPDADAEESALGVVARQAPTSQSATYDVQSPDHQGGQGEQSVNAYYSSLRELEKFEAEAAEDPLGSLSTGAINRRAELQQRLVANANALGPEISGQVMQANRQFERWKVNFEAEAERKSKESELRRLYERAGLSFEERKSTDNINDIAALGYRRERERARQLVRDDFNQSVDNALQAYSDFTSGLYERGLEAKNPVSAGLYKGLFYVTNVSAQALGGATKATVAGGTEIGELVDEPETFVKDKVASIEERRGRIRDTLVEGGAKPGLGTEIYAGSLLLPGVQQIGEGASGYSFEDSSDDSLRTGSAGDQFINRTVRTSQGVAAAAGSGAGLLKLGGGFIPRPTKAPAPLSIPERTASTIKGGDLTDIRKMSPADRISGYREYTREAGAGAFRRRFGADSVPEIDTITRKRAPGGAYKSWDEFRKGTKDVFGETTGNPDALRHQKSAWEQYNRARTSQQEYVLGRWDDSSKVIDANPQEFTRLNSNDWSQAVNDFTILGLMHRGRRIRAPTAPTAAGLRGYKGQPSVSAFEYAQLRKGGWTYKDGHWNPPTARP